MFCKNCGKENKNDADFCVECGTRLNNPTSMKYNIKEILVLMNKKTKILIGCVGLVVICAILFIAFGTNKISKKQIINDLENYSEVEIVSDDEQIESIEIIKEHKSKEPPIITYDCLITTKDETCLYQKNAMVQYDVGNRKEQLIYVNVDERKDWIITPLVGVTEEEIINALSKEMFTIDDDSWQITSDNISEFTIVKQDTDLEKKTDQVVVSFLIDDILQQAKGELSLDYTFDEKWRLNEIAEKDFTIIEKEKSEFQPTEKELLTQLIKNKATLFDGSYSQTISMSETEINDFKLVEEQTSNKGINKTFCYTATLTKPIVKINLDIEFCYTYTDVWSLDEYITIKASVNSCNIEGRWSGRYVAFLEYGNSTLEIKECTKNGEVKAVYNYTPDKISKYTNAGSYEVFGTIDFSNFMIKLEAGNWVKEDPSALSITKQDITAVINIEDSSMKGSGQNSSGFTLTKSN